MVHATVIALSAATVMTLAAACGEPDLPVQRIVAAAEVESGFRIFAIHDNDTRQSFYPAKRSDAMATARVLLTLGHRIDAGLMQISNGNWARLGLTLQSVFDPAANVCAGARVLAEDYAIERRVSCRYNTGRPLCANGYPERIERALSAPVVLHAGAVATAPPRRTVSIIEDRPDDIGVETVFVRGGKE